MEEERALSPETGKMIMVLATIELFIEVALIVLLLVVLERPVDLMTIAVLILPALLASPVIVYLVLNDRKAQQPA
ncbi:MAG: hypothetical protein LUQ35_05285 [Methanoregula sp.]|jgi:hypothetical protein|nr:hypothetical protein [Methanoregula sp.]